MNINNIRCTLTDKMGLIPRASFCAKVVSGGGRLDNWIGRKGIMSTFAREPSSTFAGEPSSTFARWSHRRHLQGGHRKASHLTYTRPTVPRSNCGLPGLHCSSAYCIMCTLNNFAIHFVFKYTMYLFNAQCTTYVS